MKIGTNIENNVFFPIQYLKKNDFQKLLLTTCTCTNQEMVARAFFNECDNKIIKHIAKKRFSLFKNSKNCDFEHTKTLFWQHFFYYFLLHS